LSQLIHLLEQPSERARLGLAAQQDAQHRFGQDRFRHSLKMLYGLKS
jgi:hypothetical protein